MAVACYLIAFVIEGEGVQAGNRAVMRIRGKKAAPKSVDLCTV